MKTKRGKITRGTYGKTRPRNKKKQKAEKANLKSYRNR